MPERAKGKSCGEPKYRIWCGDEAFHFQFNNRLSYSASTILSTIHKAMQSCRRCRCPTDFARGLVVEDANGNLWKPQVQVILVPVETQEES
jgi:hypothetical protein